MSQRILAAFPPAGNYSVSERSFMDKNSSWSPWRIVVAWGFSEFDSRPIPITILGQPEEGSHWRIKTPDGQVVEV